MKNVFIETASELKTLSANQDSILVSFSGGKDSLATLDLCCKVFKRVTCFFMHFIPGLECVERQLDYARERYGVEVRQYPHWALVKCLKSEFYTPVNRSVDNWPEWKLRDIYDQVEADTGIGLIAMGGKLSDSMWRRRNMAMTAAQTDVVAPLRNWNKFEVLAYLKSNAIPIPESSSGCSSGGIDLSAKSVLWLHDLHPQDYAKLLEWFPFAEAIVKRRELYGIGPRFEEEQD